MKIKSHCRKKKKGETLQFTAANVKPVWSFLTHASSRYISLAFSAKEREMTKIKVKMTANFPSALSELERLLYEFSSYGNLLELAAGPPGNKIVPNGNRATLRVCLHDSGMTLISV